MQLSKRKMAALALVFMTLGSVAYRYTFDLQRSSQAIYVVLHNEVDYAATYYAGTRNNSQKSASADLSKVYTHEFSMDVGGGDTYHGRSFLHNGAVIVVVDSPKPSGWFITDPSGKKPGECKKLFGSDGTEGALTARWKNICSSG
ncbi:MAG: hypothetical protein PHH47_10925 [Gallionella sp.]|nr:hypothetical protein [Gallionella sp.]MDD4947071.1 hypothetical protein [Gallionella sp.]MDD5613426.1 hypothetical protein [Gallionella sp.]